MVLDPELLAHARTTFQALEEAERRALLARAEYHTAVRRLHAGGGSLREMAGALGLSHQRVQQIVAATGGSWWSRIWRTRRVAPDAVCTFCGRPPSEVAKLVAGPAVYICDACVSMGERAVSGRTTAAGMTMAAMRTRCSFCWRPRTAERPIAERNGVRVCQSCLGLCRSLLEGRSA